MKGNRKTGESKSQAGRMGRGKDAFRAKRSRETALARRIEKVVRDAQERDVPGISFDVRTIPFLPVKAIRVG